MALVGPATYADLRRDAKIDEGEKLVAYRDLGGVWTICDGTTRGIKQGQTATPEECDALTAADLLVAVQGVERCAPQLKAPTHHAQLRASVRFNNNTGAFCKGWWRARPSIAALIRGERWCAAKLEIIRYDLVKGRRVKGLTHRRQDESAMFGAGLQCP